MAEKIKPLTKAQVSLLLTLPDERFVFANDATAKVLVRHGFATSELRLKSVQYMNGKQLSNFHTAYKRTEAGRDAAQLLLEVQSCPQ
jgi:hypothetical protein